MSSPTLQVAVTDQVALVRISGRASFNCSVDFKSLVCELRDRGYRKYVLDLSECPIMDSTFLGVLAGFGLKLAESPDEKMNLNPANIPRFKDVTKFMAEDLKRLEARKS